MEDKLVLGGKEFSSRFILGSGKYNINLIKAAVEQGGAEIITLALRRANTQEKKIFWIISRRSNITAQYFRCQKRRRSSAYCQTEPGYGLWGFCQSRDHA